MYVCDAVDLYLRELESLGRAETTVSSNRVHLRKLEGAVRQWEKDHDKRSPMQCKEMDHSLLHLYYARTGGGSGTRNNMTASMRSFVRFCERAEYVKSGTTDRLFFDRRRERYERARKHYIDPKDFKILMDCQDRHPSDRLAMALLIYTLARRSELNNVKLQDVDLGSLTIRLYRSKTRRWTEVGICWELEQEIRRWLVLYRDVMGCELDADWYLLPRVIPVRNRGDSGSWIDSEAYNLVPTEQPRHMERIVKRGLDALGVTETRTGITTKHVGEGAHTIRRSGARALLKRLSPEMGYADALVTVAAMLDHSDVKVTLKYIGMDLQKEQLNEWLRGTESMYG